MAKRKTGRSPGAIRNAEDQAAGHHRVLGNKISRKGGGSSEMEHARERSRRKEGEKNLQHSGQKTDIIYWNIKHVAGERTSHKYEGIQSESFRDGEMAQ